MRLEFDWDPAKAASNLRKHGVNFNIGMSVFRDPNAITIFDDEHSDNEDRWVTIGAGADGMLLLVIHTSTNFGDEVVRVRIISARRPTIREARQYRTGPLQ